MIPKETYNDQQQVDSQKKQSKTNLKSKVQKINLPRGSFLTLGKFLLISSTLLVICLYLFNNQITNVLTRNTPTFYYDYYYPIQSKFSRSYDDAKVKTMAEKEELKKNIHHEKQEIIDKLKSEKGKLGENIKQETDELKQEVESKFEEGVKWIKEKFSLVEEFDFSNSKENQKSIELSELSSGKWVPFTFGPFVANQGNLELISGDEGYLSVDSNPFTLSAEFSLADHLKYLIVSRDAYTIPEQGSLFTNYTVRGEAFGLTGHPFPSDLIESDINSDLRLSNGALNVLDFSTGIVADFIISNSKVFALYERLPFAKEKYGDYATFCYTIPVFDVVDKSKFNDYSIEYNKLKKSISWYVNNELVFTVDRVGHYQSLLDNTDLIKQGGGLIINKGGLEMDVYPDTIQVCFGTLSILDCTKPNNPNNQKALVVLGDPSVSYYNTNPSKLNEKLEFFDNQSLLSSRIWGQGFKLDLKKVTIFNKKN